MSDIHPQLDMISFPGKIHLIENLEDMTHALSKLRTEKILGFDTESKPSFKKGEKHSIALLQLSGEQEAYLFRLNKTGLTSELAEILSNPEIIKVGLAIRDDLKGLRELLSFEPKSFIEIQDIAKKKGLKSQGLQTITEELFQKRLSKKAKLTNWEISKLTDSQILYAATDAWIGREIYLALENML